jgi:mono/diheme cytochrome c family protein
MKFLHCGALTLIVVGYACNTTTESSKRGYEYMPDMVYSVAYDSFAPNPVTRNRITLQRPVKGTIPRGFLPFHFGPTAAEAERAGRELENPIPTTTKTLREGRELYETFCRICHGERGEGDGPLVPHIPNPPSYRSERVRSMRPGQIFHVISFGSGRMPSYATQIAAAERWMIVSYVGQLQASGAPER